MMNPDPVNNYQFDVFTLSVFVPSPSDRHVMGLGDKGGQCRLGEVVEQCVLETLISELNHLQNQMARHCFFLYIGFLYH